MFILLILLLAAPAAADERLYGIWSGPMPPDEFLGEGTIALTFAPSGAFETVIVYQGEQTVEIRIGGTWWTVGDSLYAEPEGDPVFLVDGENVENQVDIEILSSTLGSYSIDVDGNFLTITEPEGPQYILTRVSRTAVSRRSWGHLKARIYSRE